MAAIEGEVRSAMITIYCDFYCTQPIETDNYTWVVNKIQDYIPLRQRLRRALDAQDRDYTVYVQSRILAQWLEDMRDYDLQVVRWEEIDLRDRFRQKFDFSFPAELDEAAIQDLQLLNLPKPDFAAATDPSGWIIDQLIDPIWRTTNLYQGHLADLSVWAVQKGQIPVSLMTLAKARLNEWIEADNRYNIFIECMGQDSWQQAGEAVLLRWALKAYPSSFTLRQKFECASIEDCDRHLNLCRDLLRKYEADLKCFWSSWLAKNPTSEEMIVAVKGMSGLADVELSIVEQWAQQNISLLTLPIIDLIRHQFSLFSEARNVLRRLESLVCPSLPQIPDESWSTEEWLNWATVEYMPYFSWVIRNRQPRDPQIDLANRFADWLVGKYPELPFNPNASIVTNQLSRIQGLIDSKQADVVLWFIVDGLTWWQGKRLSAICAENGMGVTEIRPTLSGLPSVTSISKRAIVQGYFDKTNTNKPISQLLKTRLGCEKVSVFVYTQPSDMERAFVADAKPGIYALLYNALDEQNHHSSSFTDDESVDGHLNLIARLANQSFQQCLKQGFKAVGFVISDHGSTLLPPQCSVKKVPKFAFEFNDDNTHENTTQSIYQGTRCCAIDKTLSADDLRYLEQDWYYLSKDAYNLPYDFLIPKSYVAVERRPGGWTHGGATPEETVVACIELQPTPIQVVKPIIEVEGYLTATRASILRVTLVNPNSVPLKTVRLTLAGTQATWNTIPADSDSSIAELKISAVNSKGRSELLEWLLNCELGGQSLQFSGQMEVPIKRFQVSQVDELFDNI